MGDLGDRQELTEEEIDAQLAALMADNDVVKGDLDDLPTQDVRTCLTARTCVSLFMICQY